MMKWARALLYAHCLVALACVGLAVFSLERQAKFDRQLEVFFAHPVVSWVYWLCFLSCLAFPLGLTYQAADKMTAWRWVPAVLASLVLALVQFAALELMYPVRY
ncbi:MAG TPA: hypothetical protein VKD72_22060 [Gemmataceae bacterium]|nr:hypothetical protein [Gemmataceae bacterium]